MVKKVLFILLFLSIFVFGQGETGVKPEGYALNQNYPNPFNPSTKITFTIPEESFVKLSVYDILGNKLIDLAQENMDAGTHTIEFNPQEINSELSSGIYFYRLEAKDFSGVKKMTYLR